MRRGRRPKPVLDQYRGQPHRLPEEFAANNGLSGRSAITQALAISPTLKPPARTSSTLDPANCDGVNGSLNDTAANQSTSNSALGINGSGPSPTLGINSLYGPWTEKVDLGLSRSFTITDKQTITFQAQVFNVANHANFYVQNGNGINRL